MDPRNSSLCCSRVSRGHQPREDGHHRHLFLRPSVYDRATEEQRSTHACAAPADVSHRAGRENTRARTGVCLRRLRGHTRAPCWNRAGRPEQPGRAATGARARDLETRVKGQVPRAPAGRAETTVSSTRTTFSKALLHLQKGKSQTRNAHGSEGIPKAKRVLEEKTNMFPESETYRGAAVTSVCGGERRRSRRRRD